MIKLACYGISLMGLDLGILHAQSSSTTPRVVVQTGARPVRPQPYAVQTTRSVYPWKTHITSTIFWVGEQPSGRNLTPNCKSSWDTQWAINFGGYDNPDPAARIANHTTGEFRPKAFVPKLNPFYVALPYNDVLTYKEHKPEASRVIPWFSRMAPRPGKTVLKGRWLQIVYGRKYAFAQWEDCGPWVTDDWQYVFGNQRPKTAENGAAGIDLSPSLRDYLGLKSGEKVHWRFVDDAQVPYGPWKKFGGAQAQAKDLVAQQKYLDYLRQKRDEEFRKKPLGQ